MFKKLILLLAFIFWGGGVIAQTFYCKVTEYGYQHGAAVIGMTLEEIEFWIPAEFELNSKQAKLGADKVLLDVSGGDRVSTFHLRKRTTAGGTVFNDVYYVKIDPFSNDALVSLKAVGYETVGPVRFNCVKETKTSPREASTSNNKLKSEFDKLTNCNKKYLQQFLKGQGIYFSGIDGLWGRGTERAVNAALRLPTFKNDTVEDFFKKIQQNPICN